MPTNEGFPGLSNCYVFKSRLQEYAQKLKLSTPVYETIKEGPSHEPSFRSTVIVDDIRYDSLPGFFNRKAAEQSAAEIALIELAKSGKLSDDISLPVHEIGLSKNLLQEYAQKMNYAIPLYKCVKEETGNRATLFKCSVEIGGITYIGASAKTKKEAEIKAARIALLAIQLSSPDCQIGDSRLTVIPCRKRGVETASVSEEAANAPKAKKGRFKKKMLKKKRTADKLDYTQGESVAHTLEKHSADKLDCPQGESMIHTLEKHSADKLDHTQCELPSNLDHKLDKRSVEELDNTQGVQPSGFHLMEGWGKPDAEQANESAIEGADRADKMEGLAIPPVSNSLETSTETNAGQG